MISSSRQLKDKVRNISDGNSNKASTLIRNFMMERFLERVSISSYRDNFILKGGMLVASIVGVDMRATMDIDTTVKALPLNEADVQRIIEEICNIPLEDNVSFQIKSTRTIMDRYGLPKLRSVSASDYSAECDTRTDQGKEKKSCRGGERGTRIIGSRRSALQER